MSTSESHDPESADVFSPDRREAQRAVRRQHLRRLAEEVEQVVPQLSHTPAGQATGGECVTDENLTWHFADGRELVIRAFDGLFPGTHIELHEGGYVPVGLSLEGLEFPPASPADRDGDAALLVAAVRWFTRRHFTAHV
jgi:hypothetical protein